MAVFACQRIDKRFDAISVRDVESLVKQHIAGGREFRYRGLGLSPCTDRDDGAAFGQCDCNSFTDSRKAASDDRDSSLEVSLHGYHSPVVGIDTQGSAGASGSPFCSSSIEILSGERKNAM